MSERTKPIHVIGGGMAGSEAAWQIARAGVPVVLHEMRPVRGTEAQGRIGPDLTRIGGRHSIGAGILPNTSARMADFISATTTVKPGVLMPPYGMLEPQALADLSAYLESLE